MTNELLNEGYDYVLTSRCQSDPIERHFSKYRQMSGGRFLVSLREVKILALNSILKEDINFWEEDMYKTKLRRLFVTWVTYGSFIH